MGRRILFLTKDAMCRDYLPVYGNKYWKGKTPNIDELAEKGTVFDNYYTAAPSTVMSFRSMMFGKFAHETPYSDYVPMDMEEEETDFFNIAESYGYEGHVIWDSSWVHYVLRYGRCFPGNTRIHNIEGLDQPVGPHCNHKVPLCNNDRLAIETMAKVEQEVKEICSADHDVIIWIHLPHVLRGRICYGGDMDIFDQYVGMLRNYFEDSHIFISADHGNMDGHHGKYSYGFDVYTPAINIPLITPRIGGMSHCSSNVSNIDIKHIIFERQFPKRDFIYSDCAYYAQPHRKMAIIHNNYKYIFNKVNKKEELYDLEYDRYERNNLMSDSFFDVDRKLHTMKQEVYFYPKWEEAIRYREIFREKRKEVWKNASMPLEVRGRLLSAAKKGYVRLRKAVSEK